MVANKPNSAKKTYRIVVFTLVILLSFQTPAFSGNWFDEWKDKIIYYQDLLEKLIFLPDLPPVKKKVDILILGLDGRRGQKNRRSDAIHCFTLYPYQGKIKIVSIPRGTMSEKIMEGKEIIANTYSLGGKELTIESVEEYLDLKVDYYVIVGFSEAQAIFEKLGYNGEKTLQVLRSRKAYGIGDPQRSHNQALFMANEIMRNYPYFKKYPTVGRALLFVAHEIVDTNMPFEVMVQITDLYLENGIKEMTLAMKPQNHEKQVKDISITPETVDSVLRDQKKMLDKCEEAVENIEETKEEDAPPMSQYLAGLINYNKRYLGKDDRGIISRNGIKYEQHLWYQVENEKLSEKLHFEFTELMYQAHFNLGEYKQARSIAQSFMDERSLDLINMDYKEKIGRMIMNCEEQLYANSSEK
ncbi:MAG: LCP family protein [Deltaproteobacteria bacterium]|uniref:LCP family protein n=1 Tax=Candidatus Zymogenus saltonus TaxID=2844893 RepID=A0A9D8KEI4_9DELT|nr:LCP family protein [Candidatus Zymogenus saltonus]